MTPAGSVAPAGVVLVPWWAVRSPTSWAAGSEYVVGGASPLLLLPMRMWALVESDGDGLVIEAGQFADVPGAPPVRFEDDRGTGRRVMARRYNEGRLASVFVVAEAQISDEELREEQLAAEKADVTLRDFK